MRRLKLLRIALVGCLLAGAATLGAIASVRSGAIFEQVDGSGRFARLLLAAGFGADEIVVTGYRFSTATEIFDALALDRARTMFDLDTKAARGRIEKLPWIASVSLSRVYPGRIDVAVTERTPFAVWLDGEVATLVDATGRTLSDIPESGWPSLPRIKGRGAPDAAPALFATLAHFPKVAGRMRVAERVSERRWKLHLTDGLRIELPSEGEATALAALFGGDDRERLFAEQGAVIDLRSATRIAVRTDGGA